jgi:ribosomal protein L24
VTVGQRVYILAGRLAGAEGTVTATYRERGCGCRSVIVRLASGREWAGKVSEVRAA